jgi:long-subunit acyl-CoA synthetase (AMP-forming)
MLIAPKGHQNCIYFHPTLGPDFERISPTSELYEIVFRRNPDPKFEWNPPVFEVYPHLDEWRPGDLFRKCQDQGFEYLWEFHSRTDDLIIMSNGLKVNPVHIEVKLSDHPLLKGCLMFGEGYTDCGILLEPKEADIDKEDFLASVWPAIEAANLLVPAYARVLKQLIVVTSVEKPLARSAKGTLVRKHSLKLYELEIQQAYKEFGSN